MVDSARRIKRRLCPQCKTMKCYAAAWFSCTLLHTLLVDPYRLCLRTTSLTRTLLSLTLFVTAFSFLFLSFMFEYCAVYSQYMDDDAFLRDNLIKTSEHLVRSHANHVPCKIISSIKCYIFSQRQHKFHEAGRPVLILPNTTFDANVQCGILLFVKSSVATSASTFFKRLFTVIDET